VAARRLDRRALLERLKPVDPEQQLSTELGDLQNISLAAVLLNLAQIDHETEYTLCRTVAEHLVGELHEPETLDDDDDGAS
jgi:hypothetical protein